MTHVHLGIFERPHADFTLRRTLELLVGAEQACALMAKKVSRFVLLVPETGDEGHYICCDTVEELFTYIGYAWAALSRKGARHIHLDRSVEPDTERLIDEAAVGMEALVRPPAANDPGSQ